MILKIKLTIIDLLSKTTNTINKHLIHWEKNALYN